MDSRTGKRAMAKEDEQDKDEVGNSSCTLCPKVKDINDSEQLPGDSNVMSETFLCKQWAHNFHK